MELLAPARRLEAAIRAFKAGADAVYIGYPGFNARRMASSEVSLDDIQKLIAYSKKVDKKVYIALNILVKEVELKRLIDALYTLNDLQVDAVIFQDLGVIKIVRDYFPELTIHASTQSFISNSDSIKLLKDLGVKRVILPREINIDEIKQIKKKVNNIEIEVFIHGALCHSISGLCLFSGLYTSKSGNRGLCIQVCRKNFIESQTKEEFPFFSMRDLFLGKEILKLNGIVDSLKIEGRLKSPSWVESVVKYYRNILDNNKEDNRLKKTIFQLFSRETTKGLILKDNKLLTYKYSGHIGIFLGRIEKIDRNGFFIKLKDDIAVKDGVFIEGENNPYSVECIMKRNKKINFAKKNEFVKLCLKKKIRLRVGQKVYRHSFKMLDKEININIREVQKPTISLKVYQEKNNLVFKIYYRDKLVKEKSIKGEEKSKNIDLKSNILELFKKSGDFSFSVNNIEFINDIDIFIPISLLKEFKRNLYKKIENIIESIKEEKINNILSHIEKDFNSLLSTRYHIPKKRVLVEELPNINIDKIETIILPIQHISNLNNKLNNKNLVNIDKKVILSLPIVIFERDLKFYKELIKKAILELKIRAFYFPTFSSYAVFYSLIKDLNIDIKNFEINLGPYFYIINKSSFLLSKELTNFSSYVIPYEFTLDSYILRTSYGYIVELSYLIPLFIDVKTKTTSNVFIQKEFSNVFFIKNTFYTNTPSLFQKTPFGLFDFQKQKFKDYPFQIEVFNINDLEKITEKVVNYPLKIY